jgi:N-sulfoglucosamine sulfohydrolase
MKRTWKRNLINFIIVFLFLLKAVTSLSQNIDRPNIVFILADDATNWDIGCYGSKNSKTPNIDKLAEEGIKFNRCYQTAPMCSPTRHNIYTGMYPVKTGAYPNHTFAQEGTKSIVHYLDPLGYRVAFTGKRHIAPEEVFPFEYLSNGGLDFNAVEKFLQEVNKSENSFALMVNSHEPHLPWNKGDASLFNPETIELPPNFVDTKETREAYVRYLAEINYLDGEVGKTLELLEKYGFKENTIVVFASEQGSAFPFSKWTLYEAGVKSALIARMPGMIEPGSETNAIVEYTDLLPTFIDLAGGQISQNLDGKSLVPLFKNQNEEIKKYAYSIQTTRGVGRGSDYYGIRAIVSDKYRYIWNLTPEAEFKNNVNNGGKAGGAWYPSWEKKAEDNAFAKSLILKYRKRPKEELYDVVNDKWCMNNLAGNPQYEQIKKELRKELLKWMEECGDKGQETEMNAFEHMPNKK